MERTFFGAVLGSLAGFSSLGLLGFLWSSSPAPSGPQKPESDWRLLDPVTYENISLFPVVASSSLDTSEFVTLDEGLSTGDVVVREQGSEGLARSRDGRVISDYPRGASVNQLVLINRGKRPVLLLAGELVSGGKQDRIIGKDRHRPRRRGASALGRFLRRTRPLVFRREFFRRQNHRPSQRARTSCRRAGSKPCLGRRSRWLYCRCSSCRAGPAALAFGTLRHHRQRRAHRVLLRDLQIA